jgi:hypothetical protein
MNKQEKESAMKNERSGTYAENYAEETLEKERDMLVKSMASWSEESKKNYSEAWKRQERQLDQVLDGIAKLRVWDKNFK